MEVKHTCSYVITKQLVLAKLLSLLQSLGINFCFKTERNAAACRLTSGIATDRVFVDCVFKLSSTVRSSCLAWANQYVLVTYERGEDVSTSVMHPLSIQNSGSRDNLTGRTSFGQKKPLQKAKFGPAGFSAVFSSCIVHSALASFSQDSFRHSGKSLASSPECCGNHQATAALAKCIKQLETTAE